ncbi:MAG: electron transfer flavoprotein subunit alpha/FixB family protein [Desulfobacteraceae bacterium]|jgi:electron transfer flavoprotein alpha subunit|nr:MAG: electron transfer flavoprotein subunit alpha/FixB family protein [Desulfobacteraceae bacterium]
MTGDILVFVEQRAGSVREVSYQLLSKANQICAELSVRLTAVFIGPKASFLSSDFYKKADRVLVLEDERFGDFNCEIARDVMVGIIKEQRPAMVLVGHTPWGMDLAPAIAAKTGLPLSTDCVDIKIEAGKVKAVRQLYGGKLFARVVFKDESKGCIFTVRPGSFSVEGYPDRMGEIVPIEAPKDLPEPSSRFVEYVDTGAGEVDITQAELLVSIGRGVGEKERIEEIQELARILGGVVSCSRPVVDKGWLPKYHQVGTSGKSVKPKVYLALGISGAFQHVAGIAGAGTVIAVNKDKKAPIFRVADYGVADDLFAFSDAIKKALKK